VENKNNYSMGKPFLKWAGGKQKLIPQYNQYFPSSITNYYEPFIGGGAVFFYLKSQSRIKGKAFLCDSNKELINTYIMVRDNVSEVINELKYYEERHTKQFYYEVRALDRRAETIPDVSRAARMIYLNKTCYNGLFRVNEKGYFNVPIGKYKNPRILDVELLKNASKLLEDSIIEVADFRSLHNQPRTGDFVYFDPPYHPLSPTSNFTSYTSNNFNDNDQKELAGLFKKLSKDNVNCALSNSDSLYIRSLYENFFIYTISASRAINSLSTGRKKILELLILNYDP
jgi:DNA adenine methylase